DAVQELPVLRHRVAVVARVVHVVVEAVQVHAVLARRVEVRRLPDPRVQQDLGVLDDLRHCLCPPPVYPRFTTTVFSSVNVSIEKRPPTRPIPLCEPARPPNGRWLSQ